VLALALATLALGAAAVADASARQPALDQYVPSLPGASGNGAPRAGAPAQPGVLPAAVRTRLARQRDAALLLRIATAPGLGAPAPVRTPGHGAGPAAGRASRTPDGAALGALGAAVREPAVLALLAGMLLSAATLLGLAVAQRRSATAIRREEH
jgi:hypothetical protein